MPSAFTHAVAALSIGTCFTRPRVPKQLWVAGAVCSALPDVDVIGFRFGVHYGDFWGHRGFTHSLVFAALLAGVTGYALLSRDSLARRSIYVLYLFLATASHGILDAMTDGGLGIAFFSPFDKSRYFLPWRPIHVAPISVTRFFAARGFAVFRSEIVWVWLPALIFGVVVWLLRRCVKINADESAT